MVSKQRLMHSAPSPYNDRWTGDGVTGPEESVRRRDEDDTQPVIMPCPVCNDPMRLVSVERSVAGMSLSMERHTIKCFVCDFAMVRVFDCENAS